MSCNKTLQKRINKEMKEHPWASKATATRIAKDHFKLLKKKTKRKK